MTPGFAFRAGAGGKSALAGRTMKDAAAFCRTKELREAPSREGDFA